MMRDLRTEKEDTPRGRIAAAAFMILDEIIVRFTRAAARDLLGQIAPTCATAWRCTSSAKSSRPKLDVVKQHGTFPQAIDLQKQLDAVNFRIAQRENPPT